jgi:hypothetical protein
MIQIPKAIKFKSEKYRSFIRAQVCLGCGAWGGSVAHHEDNGFYNSGMGMKPPDTQCLPLCRECHARRHRMSSDLFWKEANVDPMVQMVNLLTEFMSEVV